MTNFDKVGIFMKTFGQEVKDKPSLSTAKINDLRVSLIEEELIELKEAMRNKDPIKRTKTINGKPFTSKNNIGAKKPTKYPNISFICSNIGSP